MNLSTDHWSSISPSFLRGPGLTSMSPHLNRREAWTAAVSCSMVTTIAMANAPTINLYDDLDTACSWTQTTHRQVVHQLVASYFSMRITYSIGLWRDDPIHCLGDTSLNHLKRKTPTVLSIVCVPSPCRVSVALALRPVIGIIIWVEYIYI